MKTRIFFILFLLCGFEHLMAQNPITDGFQASVVNVNGLRIWGHYTSDSIALKLGAPQLCTTGVLSEIEFSGVSFSKYQYSDGSTFTFYNDRLFEFKLRSPRFVLNNYIKVGDSASTISNFSNLIGSPGGFYPVPGTMGPCVYIYIPSGETLLNFYFTNNPNLTTTINTITFDTDFF
jgi:hypothetical protein